MEEMDNLTKDVLAASRAGMSYGNWKALHPKTKKANTKKKSTPDIEEKIEKVDMSICPVCGKAFKATGKHRVMCSAECRIQRDYEHKKAYAERLRAGKNKKGA